MRVWVALGLGTVAIVLVWQLARSERFTLLMVDQFVWAVLISHTVFVSRVRDARLLAEERSVTAGIIVEFSIWCLCLLYGLIRLSHNLGRLRALRGISARYVTLLLLLAIASIGYSVGPAITFAWCVKLATIIVVACVLVTPDDSLGSVRRFLRATYWGLLLMLLQFLLLAALAPQDAVYRGLDSGIWRLGGFVLPSTQLSPIAGLVCVLILINVLSGHYPRYWKTILTVSAALLLGSLGRAGMIATAATVLMVLYYFRRLRTAAVILVGLAIIFLIVPGFFDFSVEMITRRQTEPQILSLTGRVDLWETAIELIAMKPLFGWGYVSGSRIALLSSFRYWAAPHAHNAILEIMLDLGFVGTLALLGSLISPAIVYVRLLRDGNRGSTEFPQIASLTMLAFLLLFTIDGMFTAGYGGAPRYESTILIGGVFSADLLRCQIISGRRRTLANPDHP